MTGRPPTCMSGFGVVYVWGRRRVPFPASGMTTFTFGSSLMVQWQAGVVGMQARFPTPPQYPPPLDAVKPSRCRPEPARLAQDRPVIYFPPMKSLALVSVALSFGVCAAVPAPIAAQSPQPAAEPPPSISVSANATVRRAPDRAAIQLAVETQAPTAREASSQNAALMESVLAAVRAQGVPSSRIRTLRLELHPRYDNRRDAEPEIVGYRAVNQVTVHLDDVDLVGRVVDAAVDAGANRVTGIRFELSEPESAYHEALRQAIERARAEAEVAASALGRSLGEPLQVSTGGFDAPAPRFREEAMAVRMQDAAPPVEPGELEVRATVSIVWRLGS